MDINLQRYKQYYDFILDDWWEYYLLSLNKSSRIKSTEYHHMYTVNLTQLAFLRKKCDGLIIDVGCGENRFKRFEPNQIVGVDINPCADIKDFVDDDFVKNYIENFGGLYACNSLHFDSKLDWGYEKSTEGPRTNLGFFENTKRAFKMVKPGGYACVSYGAHQIGVDKQIADFNQEGWEIINYWCSINNKGLFDYVKSCINELPVKVKENERENLLKECLYIFNERDTMNGNYRITYKKYV